MKFFLTNSKLKESLQLMLDLNIACYKGKNGKKSMLAVKKWSVTKKLAMHLPLLILSPALNYCSSSTFKASSHADHTKGEADQSIPTSPPQATSEVKDENTKVHVAAKKSELCWFAVSGVQMGFPYKPIFGGPTTTAVYGSTFPKTISGGTIGHGEIFDLVGGVFLGARPEAYVYGQTGPGITKAVDNSFDSIAVAPGMHALIKDGNGNKIFDADGPFIGESDVVFGETSEYGQGQYYTEFKKIENLPQWMKKYLIDHSKFEVIENLTKARSVVVTTVAGSECD